MDSIFCNYVMKTKIWKTIRAQKETSPLAHSVRNSLPHKSFRFCSPMLNRWKPRSGNHMVAKRNFPSCSLCSQFTASQKLPLLFPNAKQMVSIIRLLARYARICGFPRAMFGSLRNICNASHSIYLFDTFRYASLHCKHQYARTWPVEIYKELTKPWDPIARYWKYICFAYIFL